MQQTQDNSLRIIFLKKFTQEILLNINLEEKKKERIELEKMKQRIFGGEISREDAFRRLIRAHSPTMPGENEIVKDYNPSISSKFPENQIKTSAPAGHILPIQRPAQVIKNVNPGVHAPQHPQQHFPPKILQKPVNPLQQRYIPPVPETNIAEVKPEAEEKPAGFNLGKVEALLKDNLIQSIECPGPGKNILVKKYNKINMTKISLTSLEIIEIINRFANEARIPVVGGILKAAVGNLVISAVVSEFVGARFIINRINNLQEI